MATELKRQVGSYRLLFFQPDPEDGDRVCIGVLVHEGHDYTVLYDKKFSKVHCIAPGLEPELIKFYLDNLESNLHRKSPDDLALTLKKCGPQMIASEERRLLLPLTEQQKMRLLERFVLPASKLKADATEASAQQEFADHLRLFVTEFVRPSEVTILHNARPHELFGKSLPHVRPVAIAVRKAGKIVMVDGVDLGVLTPTQAITRANHVGHTFWQYGRFRSDDLAVQQVPFTRVGVVLNGAKNKSGAYFDAHDYAVHQFQKEADFAVDTTSREGAQQFEAAFSSVQ